MKRKQAFTLVELLVVICIVTLLAGLIVPQMERARARARTMSCANNLRQIGMAATLYASEHNGDFPTIEPWPTSPIYTSSTSNAVTLSGAFKDYGITDLNLRCLTDVMGTNYYKKEGSSYCWCPMASGQKLTSPKVAWLGGDGTSSSGDEIKVTLSNLLMAYDYDAIHMSAYNVLYADGHVASPVSISQ
jgi:prepilin-type processing-associated H-X9-DG protein/prepilin-type N-terminal cleavage/methylation domain-containing protein